MAVAAPRRGRAHYVVVLRVLSRARRCRPSPTAGEDRAADDDRAPGVHAHAEDRAAGRLADLAARPAMTRSPAVRLLLPAAQPGTDPDTVAGRVRASHAQAEPARAATRAQDAGGRSKLGDRFKARMRSARRSAQLDR